LPCAEIIRPSGGRSGALRNRRRPHADRYANGSAHGDYASVTSTSGLFAGSSGYAVTVGGTTTLTGAALASTADASKNMLSTGALVTKDLTNSMSWKASYWGFSASVSTSGQGGVQPGLSQKSGGSSSGLAQATIAPGSVSIVNASLQKSLTGKTPDQIVAALNRATAAQNKAANKLPGGLAQTLQNQADRSNALVAASTSTAKFVGDVASTFWSSAAQTVGKLTKESQTRQLTDEEKQTLADARQQMDLWGEGGPARILLHGATQGVLAWIGGGYSLDAGLRGAGGAMIAQGLGAIVAERAQSLLKEAGIESSDRPGALANLIAEAAITGLASSFGNMAALTAASVDMNNRQLHPMEIGFLTDKERVKRFAEQVGIGEEEAGQILFRVGVTMVDSRWYDKYYEKVPYYDEALGFIQAESVNKQLDNGQFYFKPVGKDFYNFELGAYDALDVHFPERHMYYHMYLSDGESWITSPYNFAVGVTKGSGYFLGDFSQGVTKLLTEPGEVWDGVKVLASQPGAVLGKAFMTNVYLNELYGWVGDDAEAMAVFTRFTANTVTAIDGAAAVPGMVKGAVQLAGDGVNLVRGLGAAAEEVPGVRVVALDTDAVVKLNQPEFQNALLPGDKLVVTPNVVYELTERVGITDVDAFLQLRDITVVPSVPGAAVTASALRMQLDAFGAHIGNVGDALNLGEAGAFGPSLFITGDANTIGRAFGNSATITLPHSGGATLQLQVVTPK
jgi:hypothetical protein